MFHKGPLPIMGPVRSGVFYFWIFFLEINGRNCQKFVLRQMYGKTCFYTTKLFISAIHVGLPKFRTAEKLDLRKTKLVRDRPSSFCSTRTQTYATELKKNGL
jgi:hypothetical protein